MPLLRCVFTQPTLLCRWDRLSSVLCYPTHFSQLWDSFVFSWQSYNNQAPQRCETLITLSYHCRLLFNLSMNHFSSIHCVTETRDLDEFIHFVYSCCQVNVNVKVSLSVGIRGNIFFRLMTCFFEFDSGVNFFNFWCPPEYLFSTSAIYPKEHTRVWDRHLCVCVYLR